MNHSNFDRKAKRLYASLSLLALTLMVSIIPAFATDPLAAVNNLSNFISSHWRDPAGLRHPPAWSVL